MLPQGQVEAFDQGRVDAPAVLGQPGLDRCKLTTNNPMLDADQPPADPPFDNLDMGQLRSP